MNTTRIVKNGESVSFNDDRDLDPEQRLVRSMRQTQTPRVAPADMVIATARAANTDPIKGMVDAPYYQQYDQRVEDAWRDPAPVVGVKPGGKE